MSDTIDPRGITGSRPANATMTGDRSGAASGAEPTHDGVLTGSTTRRRMQWFMGVVGLTFAVLALLHVPHPSPWLWLPYAAGAVLAFVTLMPGLTVFVSRILAIAATVLVFFFFAGFFTEVPHLESDWYQGQEGWAAVARLFGAFALLPVLSDFSCRCKAECREAHSGHRHWFRHPRIFTAPDHVRPR